MSDSILTNIEGFREAFDRSFAQPAQLRQVDKDRLLIVRAGQAVFALPAGSLASVQKEHDIVALPTRAPELAGAATIRGRIIPVYSLARLLGMPAEAVSWIAVSAEEPLAFGFSAVIRLAEVDRNAIRSSETSMNRQFIAGLADVGAELLPVVDVPRLVSSLVHSQKR